MFAVIKTGGKQYRVQEGQKLRIEKVPVADGAALDFEVLLLADEDGSLVKVGRPTIAGAKVVTKVIGSGLGEKVHVIKFKRKVRYKRDVGHRQPFTEVLVEKIS